MNEVKPDDFRYPSDHAVIIQKDCFYEICGQLDEIMSAMDGIRWFAQNNNHDLFRIVCDFERKMDNVRNSLGRQVLDERTLSDLFPGVTHVDCGKEYRERNIERVKGLFSRLRVALAQNK